MARPAAAAAVAAVAIVAVVVVRPGDVSAEECVLGEADTQMCHG